jgi:hypothetical protein
VVRFFCVDDFDGASAFGATIIFKSQLTDVFVQCCRCSSCSAPALALLVAPASRARCALGVGRGAGYIALVFFSALPLRLVLGVPLASGEAPMLFFLMFAVLLLLLVLLGGVALKSGVAWHSLPILLLLFAVLPLFFL